MKVTIQTQNFKLQEFTEEYATKKLDALQRYLPNIREVRLDLNRKTNRGEDHTIAQVTVIHARGALIRTEERTAGFSKDSLETAIAEAMDKMYSRIKRFKGKREATNRRGMRDAYNLTPEELAASEDMPPFLDIDGDEDYVTPEIVKRKQVPIMAMNEREAIEQMELLGHTFFLFRDMITGKVNVLYRRRDGAYGVLAPYDA
ncbi:MAG: HPF/RaiA family ribosome-associated protein [Anaerolineae bacterium]|jgi:ribosomal subunit interface protein|nr:HPF/RaiA family ribosome-associated protein [Anaerolineae bacterium]